MGLIREVYLLWGPVSLGKQRGTHFPLLLKAARSRDLQVAAAVAGFLPAQFVWLGGLAGAREDVGVLVLLGAASPVWAGRVGLPGEGLGQRLRPHRGFLAFLLAVG